MYLLNVVYHEVLLYLISQEIGYDLIKKGKKNPRNYYRPTSIFYSVELGLKMK